MAQIPPLILITGASGYVGSHVVARCLAQGHRVRAAGRNQQTCDRMHSLHSSHTSQFETIIIPDITTPGAFDKAVRGATGIIHMASPFTYKIEDNERDLILPAVNGTLEILKSALKSHHVKHIVMTSSFAAVADFSKGLRPGHTYEESQWNPMTWEYTKTCPPGVAYAGSKKLAEEAAWKFMRDNASEIGFGLTTICPVMIYGPPLPGSLTLGRLGQSMTEIYSLMDGSRGVPPSTPMPVFVDVRDVAVAHEAAMRKGLEAGKGSGGQNRYLLCGGAFSMDGVCGLLREKIPELEGRVPVSTGMMLEHYVVDSAKARRELGVDLRGFEECFLDTAKTLMELERC